MKKALVHGGANALNICSVASKGESTLLGYANFLDGYGGNPEYGAVGRRSLWCPSRGKGEES